MRFHAHINWHHTWILLMVRESFPRWKQFEIFAAQAMEGNVCGKVQEMLCQQEVQKLFDRTKFEKSFTLENYSQCCNCATGNPWPEQFMQILVNKMQIYSPSTAQLFALKEVPEPWTGCPLPPPAKAEVFRAVNWEDFLSMNAMSRAASSPRPFSWRLTRASASPLSDAVA